MLQYYASALSHPAADRRAGRAGRGLGARTCWARCWPSGAAGQVEIRAVRARRQAPHPRPRASATRGSRSTRRSSRPSAGASSAWTRSNGLQPALELDTLPVRIECFDISHVGGTHTVASMVVFEGGAPKKSDYRRFTIREVDAGDDFAAMAEVLARRYAQWEKQAERSPYDAERDASFAALPEPRRHRRRQGPARRGRSSRCRASASAAWPSSRSRSGSRRSSCPASRTPSCCRTTRRSCSCCSASATRRTVSPSPTTGSGATRR